MGNVGPVDHGRVSGELGDTDEITNGFAGSLAPVQHVSTFAIDDSGNIQINEALATHLTSQARGRARVSLGFGQSTLPVFNQGHTQRSKPRADGVDQDCGVIHLSTIRYGLCRHGQHGVHINDQIRRHGCSPGLQHH